MPTLKAGWAVCSYFHSVLFDCKAHNQKKCNNGYWVLICIPSPELRWCLLLCNSFLSGVGKKGSWKLNCTQSFPIPPPALYVSKAKMYMHLGRNVCRSRSYQQGRWECTICSPALQVLLSLETFSEILLISRPKKCSCLAVLGQYCRRFGCYSLVLLSLQLLGRKHQLS